MRVVITGNAWLIGSRVFDRLSKDHEVFGLDLRGSPSTNVVGDILDFDLVKSVVSHVDVVVHCAAQTSAARSVEDPLFDDRTNVMGTLNLLEAARMSKGLKKLIYVSSAAVYGSPQLHPHR